MMSTSLSIPAPCLVMLVGPSSCGKSTFARKHFRESEILCSDAFRAMVADDESDQTVSREAFDALHFVLRQRLKLNRLTVVDATNVQQEARRGLLAIAREFHFLTVALVFDLPQSLCLERARQRTDREIKPHVIRQQCFDLRRSLRGLREEGFRSVYTFERPDQLDALEVVRQPLWNDRRHDSGPFDVIGDVHGCGDELESLLRNLGYHIDLTVDNAGERRYQVSHSQGRRVIFLGDLVDRGPRIADCLRLAMDMVETGKALCVVGNHEQKLHRKLSGKNVTLTHGLAASVAQLEGESEAFRERVRLFLDSLISHYVLDQGRLVVAHAGLKEEMHGRASGRVREFCVYGDTTGETDEFGLPVRLNWAADYRGRAMVVYGHTQVPEAEWLNWTLCIDTGCVFGGKLTALRYPERELVSVPAARVYQEPKRPLLPPPSPDGLSAQQSADLTLHAEDVLGKRIIQTRLMNHLSIREQNSAAALEAMSRFALDPRWLIYLPPTMSPSATSDEPGYLEHPLQALAYYRDQGISRVICQRKHMGSRAVVVLCRDEAAAARRFGLRGEGPGAVYTRMGRRFFNQRSLEEALLARLLAAMEKADLWRSLGTDWVLLDAELLPWSLKAQELLRTQYAPVGAAGVKALEQAVQLLERAQSRGLELPDLLQKQRDQLDNLNHYQRAWRGYCWPVHDLSGVRLAPFHLLASEGRAHFDRDHVWHMETLARLCAADPGLLLATPYRLADVTDPASEAEIIAWWLDMTAEGGEGMVVKPFEFLARGHHGLVQPAVKCRGREYLRIIYGPDYTAEVNLERLRERGLSGKRSLALRELALGVEAVERFVRREPLRKVHECVFGVMALESEPVDPRL